MTAQTHEIIILDNRQLPMDCTPSFPKSDCRIIETEDNTLYSSSCWRRYVGTWEIKDKKLYLINIKGMYKLLDSQPLFSDWYSGVLTIPQGEMLEYVHSDFLSVYEKEIQITIDKGNVTKAVVADNRKSKITEYDLSTWGSSENKSRPSYAERYAEVFGGNSHSKVDNKFIPISIEGMLKRLIKAFIGTDVGVDIKIPSEVAYLYGYALESKLISEEDYEQSLLHMKTEIEDAYESHCLASPFDFYDSALPRGLTVNFRKFRQGVCVYHELKELFCPYPLRLFKDPFNERNGYLINRQGFKRALFTPLGIKNEYPEGYKTYYHPRGCVWSELQDYHYQEGIIFATRTLPNGDILQLWYETEKLEQIVDGPDNGKENNSFVGF